MATERKINYRKAGCCANCIFCIFFYHGFVCEIDEKMPSGTYSELNQWAKRNHTDASCVCDNFKDKKQ